MTEKAPITFQVIMSNTAVLANIPSASGEHSELLLEATQPSGPELVLPTVPDGTDRIDIVLERSDSARHRRHHVSVNTIDPNLHAMTLSGDVLLFWYEFFDADGTLIRSEEARPQPRYIINGAIIDRSPLPEPHILPARIEEPDAALLVIARNGTPYSHHELDQIITVGTS